MRDGRRHVSEPVRELLPQHPVREYPFLLGVLQLPQHFRKVLELIHHPSKSTQLKGSGPDRNSKMNVPIGFLISPILRVDSDVLPRDIESAIAANASLHFICGVAYAQQYLRLPKRKVDIESTLRSFVEVGGKSATSILVRG